MPTGEWTHVAITYDASSSAEGLQVYFNGASVPVDVLRDNLYGTIRFPNKAKSLVIGGPTIELGFRDGAVDQFLLFDDCLTPLELDRIVHGDEFVRQEIEGDDQAAWLTHYLQRVDGECRQAEQQLREARKAEHDFIDNLRSIMVMRDKPTPARANVLHRGAYDQPGEEVVPGVPAAILLSVAGQPRH